MHLGRSRYRLALVAVCFGAAAQSPSCSCEEEVGPTPTTEVIVEDIGPAETEPITDTPGPPSHATAVAPGPAETATIAEQSTEETPVAPQPSVPKETATIAEPPATETPVVPEPSEPVETAAVPEPEEPVEAAAVPEPEEPKAIVEAAAPKPVPPPPVADISTVAWLQPEEGALMPKPNIDVIGTAPDGTRVWILGGRTVTASKGEFIIPVVLDDGYNLIEVHVGLGGEERTLQRRLLYFDPIRITALASRVERQRDLLSELREAHHDLKELLVATDGIIPVLPVSQQAIAEELSRALEKDLAELDTAHQQLNIEIETTIAQLHRFSSN